MRRDDECYIVEQEDERGDLEDVLYFCDEDCARSYAAARIDAILAS